MISLLLANTILFTWRGIKVLNLKQATLILRNVNTVSHFCMIGNRQVFCFFPSDTVAFLFSGCYGSGVLTQPHCLKAKSAHFRLYSLNFFFFSLTNRLRKYISSVTAVLQYRVMPFLFCTQKNKPRLSGFIMLQI